MVTRTPERTIATKKMKEMKMEMGLENVGEEVKRDKMRVRMEKRPRSIPNSPLLFEGEWLLTIQKGTKGK